MGFSAKPEVLSLAQRCKNILAANYRAHLYTIKADGMGSKNDVHGSKIKYLLRKGRSYIWIQEGDPHNVNTVIDERGSLSVCCPIPGPLMGLLKSTEKVPARVALAGDLIRLNNEKVDIAAKYLEELTLQESKIVCEASYSVSSILHSASSYCKLRSEAYKDLVERSAKYAIYAFKIRSCSYVDSSGDIHEVDANDVRSSRIDPLASLSENLIDGINQNQSRRRALMLFCFVHYNTYARDALMLAIDRKGFNVLAKVHREPASSSLHQHQWKEFRFTFKDEVPDIEAFCCLLVQMEEEALEYVKSFSGIG